MQELLDGVLSVKFDQERDSSTEGHPHFGFAAGCEAGCRNGLHSNRKYFHRAVKIFPPRSDSALPPDVRRGSA